MRYTECERCGERTGRDDYPRKVGADGRLTSERKDFCRDCEDLEDLYLYGPEENGPED